MGLCRSLCTSDHRRAARRPGKEGGDAGAGAVAAHGPRQAVSGPSPLGKAAAKRSVFSGPRGAHKVEKRGRACQAEGGREGGGRGERVRLLQPGRREHLPPLPPATSLTAPHRVAAAGLGGWYLLMVILELRKLTVGKELV